MRVGIMIEGQEGLTWERWWRLAQAAEQRGATEKMVLKNGLTVLVTRNAAAPLVTFQLYTLGGLLAETDANNGVGSAMMELMRRGTQERTHGQIANFLDATGTVLASESGNNAFSLSMTCLKEKAGEAFGVFSDVALHPKFSGEELEQVRPQSLSRTRASWPRRNCSPANCR